MTNEQFNIWLRSHKACLDGMTWVNGRGLDEVWSDFTRSDWLIWLVEKAKLNDSKLRKVACAMVRRTPLADGRMVWDLLTDERSRRAVEVAEVYADGKATDEDLAAAWEAARDARAAWAALAAAARAAAARAAAARAAADAADAADAAVWAARDAAWSAARGAAWSAARDAARDAQCNIIREMVTVDEVRKLIEEQL